MSSGAQLSVRDLRRAGRHPVDYDVIAELHRVGDIALHVCNVSANGFLIDNCDGLSRGDRLIVSFPVIGRIEAYVIWIHEARAGFQFERIIRVDDYLAMIDTIQPNPKLRKLR